MAFEAVAIGTDTIEIYSSELGSFNYTLTNDDDLTFVNGIINFTGLPETEGFLIGWNRQTISGLISGTNYSIVIDGQAAIPLLTWFDATLLNAADQRLLPSTESDYKSRTGLKTYGEPEFFEPIQLSGTVKDFSTNEVDAELKQGTCLTLSGLGDYLLITAVLTNVTFIRVKIQTNAAGSANVSRANLFRLANTTDFFLRIDGLAGSGVLKTGIATGSTVVNDGLTHEITIEETDPLLYEVRVDGNLEFTLNPPARFNLGLSGGILFGRANTVAGSIPSYNGKVFDLYIEGRQGGSLIQNKHYYPMIERAGVKIKNTQKNQDTRVINPNGTEWSQTQEDFFFLQKTGGKKYEFAGLSEIDFNIGAGAEITEVNNNTFQFTVTSGSQFIEPNAADALMAQLLQTIELGIAYQIELTVSNYVSGTLTLNIGGNTSETFNSDGAKVVNLEASTTAGLFRFETTDFNGDIEITLIDCETCFSSELNASLESTGLDVLGNALDQYVETSIFEYSDLLEWKSPAVSEGFAALPPPNSSPNYFGVQKTGSIGKSDLYNFSSPASGAQIDEILKLFSNVENTLPKIVTPPRTFRLRFLEEDLSPLSATITAGTETRRTDVSGEVDIFLVSGTLTVTPDNFPAQTIEFDFSGDLDQTLEFIVINTCINPEPINRLNFIRWHALNYDIPFSLPLICCETQTPNPANPFIFKDCKALKPYYVTGEQAHFYANIEGGINDLDFADWKLSIFKASDQSIVLDDIATINQIDLGGGFFQFSANFTFPTLEDGTYHYLIYNMATQKTKFISNPFQVISQNINKYSTLVTYTHDKDRDFFPYSSQAITNRIRIPLFEVQTESPFNSEITQYTAVSTGKPRISRNLVQQVKEFELHKADILAHEAMYSALLHSLLNINNRRFVLVGGEYGLQEPNRLTNISSARFSCFDYEFSRINS